MSTTVLHYIYDPLCGWCYAAAPLVAAAREVGPIQAHAGGMMAGAARRQVSPQLRNFVMPHDRRIAQLSGQPFGEAYTNGLLCDNSAILDSAPPISAILAAEQLASRGLDMLSRLQVAHYVEGRRIADTTVLLELSIELGLARENFEPALRAAIGPATEQHIRETHRLMGQVGAEGFPTFALEQNGDFQVVDFSDYLGHPREWQAWLRAQG